MTPRRVALAGGLVFSVLGCWGLLAPRSFYTVLATYPPYNAHFLRDVGAFQVGLGAVLLLAWRGLDGLSVALLGVGVGATAHLGAHVVDRDLGGRPAVDIPLLALLAVALLGGGWAQRRGRLP